MAGNLLHIIRDAEKNAEKIIKDANENAQTMINNARTEARQMLNQVRAEKDKTESNYLLNIQEKAQSKLKELGIKLEENKKTIEEEALKKKKEAIDYVVDSILKIS